MFARCVLAVVLLWLAPWACAQEVRFGLDLDYLYDDNVSRGLEPDRRSDSVLTAEGSAAHSIYLGPRSGLALRAGLRYSQFLYFKDLSNLGLSGRAAYRLQPTEGFSAPWLELAGDVQWLRHGDSALRDGTIGGLSAEIGSLLTDRVRAAAGAGMQKRSSDDESGLFDLSTTRLWATLDYRLGIRSTLYGRVTRIAGDHVFTAADPALQGALSAGADVIVLDPALQRGYGGGLSPIGYRLEATTWVYDLGFNYPLAGNHGLDFSLSHAISKTDAGNHEYDLTQLRVAYLYRFQ